MNDVKITIRNYRSIPYNNPITIQLREGITFILGVNNVGKSNFLKFFYEFRNIIDGGGAIIERNLHFNPDSLLYSNVKNQNSSEKYIEIQIESKSKNLVLIIRPQGKLDSPNFRLSIKTNSFDLGGLLEIRKLFFDSMYIGSFRTPTVATNAQVPYYDIQIGHGFVEVWDNWANGQGIDPKKKIEILKAELKELFEFKEFDIYPNSANTSLLVKTDDGIFNLEDLGGGIGHFILVLGNALIREPSFILIDEPENALHPKMQETFVRTLASKAKLGLIATSHSIGLARSVGADRIYSLSRDNIGRFNLSIYGDSYKPSITDAINELGYSQFVEIGGNNILLVEGTGDIKSFKEILRKYGIEHHFIIMDLGGSGLISGSRFDELSELKRLNAKSYNVIFDSEITQENEKLKKSFKEFIEVCKKLNFNVFPTEVHSTDNYIKQDAINTVIGSSYTALDKYENLNRRSKENKWGKSLNWKMFRVMNKSDFEGTELDKFITETLIPLTN